MRILHVFDHSLPERSGYSLRSAAILREQRRLGWETTQVTGPKHTLASPPRESIDGLDFYRTVSAASALARLPALGQLDVVLRLRARLNEIIRLEQPDIVHAHSPCLNGLAALGLGKPLLYELRSSWEDAAVSSGVTTEGSLRYRASRALETYVLRRADAVVAICRGLALDVVARGVSADRITVVGNAVDADSFARQPEPASLRRELGLDGKYVLGFIGSFFRWEGLALLIEALPHILQSRPDVRVLLVGSGPEEATLRAAVERLHLREYVVFAGSRPHAQVGAAYEAVDLLVYPRVPMRLTEMVTPLKPLEAMALGKVFVASDVGGHRELVRDRATGVLFRAGDVPALAQAVVATAADPELQRRLREAGPRFVRDERTWAGEVARYEPVYRSLMSVRLHGRAVQGRG